MHTSMNSLLICLPIIVSLIQNNSVEAQQTECQTRTATGFVPVFIPLLGKEWVVTRATLRTLLPKGLPDPTMNNSTPITYFESSKGAIHIEREWTREGHVTKRMRAYSAKYDNIAEYREEQKRVDPSYFIWKSEGKSMFLHFRDGTEKDIDLSDVPVIENALARMSTINYYGFLRSTGKITWALYQDCDEDFAWIEIAKWVFDDPSLLNETNETIDDYLSTHPGPLRFPQMVKLPNPTTLPF